MMNNLFTVTCPKNHYGDGFKVVLNQPLSVVENPYVYKKEMKRVLLEVVDSYPKVTLGYSGGSDSGFVLCCIRDLIEEGKLKTDTINIVLCAFYYNKSLLNLDLNRAMKFAHSLGIKPDLLEFDLKSEWDGVCKYVLSHKITDMAGAMQTMLGDKIDGHFFIVRRWGRKRRCGFDISVGNDDPIPFIWDTMAQFKTSNVIDLQCWDNKIFSSFITPYTLKSKNVNMEPFNNLPNWPWNEYQLSESNIYYPHLMIQETMYRTLIYLQCYPEMTEILYKIPTCSWDLAWNLVDEKEQEIIGDFSNFIKSMPEVTCNLEFPDGKLFTKKDLTNATDYGII